MKKIFLSVLLLFIFFGCAKKETMPTFDEYLTLPKISQAQFKIIGFSQIEGWEDNDFNTSLKLFKKSCKRISKKKMFSGVCELSKTTNNPKAFFEENFLALKLFTKEHKDKGIITGYYEPLLHGSLKKSQKFRYPVYKKPKDLITVRLSSIYPKLKNFTLRGRVFKDKLIPYYTREEIEKNKLNAEIICYVDSKIDLFFLQIQGSGKVLLDNNQTINLAYANQNGHPFRSPARKLIQQKVIKPYQGSLQGFKKWLEQNPKMIDKTLNLNPSFVFFRQSSQGATGALGIELVAKKSVAVDKRFIPLGSALFLQTKNPLTKQPINSIVFAWDVGGAIKGEIRADYFWGFAEEAKKFAGRMKEKGSLILLLPKQAKNLAF